MRLSKLWPLALLPALVFLACCKHATTPNPLADLPDESLLNIPTYDGSNQVVHPDVMLLETPINGYKFMMGVTPYPYYNARLENPSVLLSKNGVDWVEPMPGENPIVPAPAYDHNDDPDILYDRHRGLYYLHYLQTMRPDSENEIRMESQDGLTWKAHTAVHWDLKKDESFVVSPAVVLQTDGSSYRMYYIRLNDPSGIYKLKTLYSPDGLTWDKTQEADINYQLPTPGQVPWHVDVFRHGSTYYMLACCRNPQLYSQDEKIMFATSTDGLNWTFRQKPLMVSDPNFHQCNSMYRSTGVIYDNILAVWYSMDDINNEWHVGVKKFDLDTL